MYWTCYRFFGFQHDSIGLTMRPLSHLNPLCIGAKMMNGLARTLLFLDSRNKAIFQVRAAFFKGNILEE